MLKIWVKTLKNTKISCDYIYVTENNYNNDEFYEILRELCGNIDIPTPLLLSSHIRNFEKFKQCRFKSSEFIESVSFDEMTLENITE